MPDFSVDRIMKDSSGAMDACAKESEKGQSECYSKIASVLQTSDTDQALKACSSIKEEEAKRTCYQNILAAQNITEIKFGLCSKIDMVDLTLRCQQDIFNNIKATNADFAFQVCNAMPDPLGTERSPRGDCIQEIIRVQNGTDAKLTICNKIDRDDWKKSCIENIANEEQDPVKAMAICNEINENNFRQHCYKGI